MTTTTTVQFPGSSAGRIRRTVIAAIAASALIVSAGIAVDRVIGDPSTATVEAPNIALPEAAVAGPLTAADICSGGLAWACSYNERPTVISAADVCSGGLGWACIYTPQH